MRPRGADVILVLLLLLMLCMHAGVFFIVSRVTGQGKRVGIWWIGPVGRMRGERRVGGSGGFD